MKNKRGIYLALAALGVVFGDIGTSPLYALSATKDSLVGTQSPDTILGILSLFFWALAIVVTIKYIIFVMRASNKGEGGIFALLALLKNGNGDKNGCHKTATKTTSKWVKVILPSLIVLGACLLYADGIITPAISVLSAWEGLEVSSETFRPYVIPLTYLTLIGLFAIQRWGTERVGKLFTPVMIVWFTAIAILGLVQIAHHPEVLKAANPWYAIRFCIDNGNHTWIVLGAVVLCITGGEALYADMGHFGARPIRVAWFAIVYPSLLLNYFGQGAKLLSATGDVKNLFFAIVPEPLLIPMVILATAATVIASQALISGAFSLTKQAVSLGLFPRLKIVHTNPDHEGQIYIPFINWALLFGCLLLVHGFETSSNLAAAYGIAVTGTMAVTTIAFMQVATDRLGWKPRTIIPICIVLATVDLCFFGANTLKFWSGGYVPVLIAIGLFILMSTWQWGRESLVFKAIANYTSSIQGFSHETITNMLARDVAVASNHLLVLTSNLISCVDDSVPPPLQMHLAGMGNDIPDGVTYLTVTQMRRPKCQENERLKKDILCDGKRSIETIEVRYGYQDQINIGPIADEVFAKYGDRVTILVGEEFFIYEKAGFWRTVATELFRMLLKITPPAYGAFGLTKKQLLHVVAQVIPICIGKSGDATISV